MNTNETDTELERITAAIRVSYRKAREKHRPMRSPHEGYAILLEEVDELWAEVKAWQPEPWGKDATSVEIVKYQANITAMRKEAMHVAAMALAFILEICDNKRNNENG